MTYRDDVETMPQGLERVVAQVLRCHSGKAEAIGREEMVTLVNRLTTATDRQVRLSIRELRRAGWLICGMGGGDGGYYLAESREEFDEFHREFTARVSDISETAAAMRRSAERKWGENLQERMF